MPLEHFSTDQMTENRLVTLKSRPQGRVRTDDFGIVTSPVFEPATGQLLVRNLYLSIDPGVRNLLGAEKGYLPPIAVGFPVTCSVLGTVVESRHEGFSDGELVIGRGMMGDYSIIEPNELCWKVDADAVMQLTHALGVLGITGRTAYFGLLEVARVKSGETVLVSGASGSVGSIVGQIARIEGCRAVGIAGGSEKCERLIGEFGFADAIDYRELRGNDLSAAISAACPGGVDVFFDNVGGSILDATLPVMNFDGRVILCGLMSQYDGAPPPTMNNLFLIVARALTVRGFLLPQFASQYPEADSYLARAISEGSLRFREQIFEGLESAIPAFVRQFDGTIHGKPMIRL